MESAPVEVIEAGPFGEWLAQFRAMLHGDGGIEVRCGDCVGCCVSSYHIPIRADDAAAREKVPERYLAVARGQPVGHFMMGYLPDGTCPMLHDGRCSIYSLRPQTCRDYDCRVFAAAGIDAGNADKAVINRRVRAWRFVYASDAERQVQRAVQRAAAFIRDRREAFRGRAPSAPTGTAVLAIKSYEVFMDERCETLSDTELANAIVAAGREFDASRR